MINLNTKYSGQITAFSYDEYNQSYLPSNILTDNQSAWIFGAGYGTTAPSDVTAGNYIGVTFPQAEKVHQINIKYEFYKEAGQIKTLYGSNDTTDGSNGTWEEIKILGYINDNIASSGAITKTYYLPYCKAYKSYKIKGFGGEHYIKYAEFLQFDISEKTNINNVEFEFNKILYIDQNIGNDSTGNGSSQNPYKTIEKGMQSINQDFTCLYIKSGEYTPSHTKSSTYSAVNREYGIFYDTSYYYQIIGDGKNTIINANRTSLFDYDFQATQKDIDVFNLYIKWNTIDTVNATYSGFISIFSQNQTFNNIIWENISASDNQFCMKYSNGLGQCVFNNCIIKFQESSLFGQMVYSNKEHPMLLRNTIILNMNSTHGEFYGHIIQKYSLLVNCGTIDSNWILDNTLELQSENIDFGGAFQTTPVYSGDPQLLNSDGSTSIIGVYGGKYQFILQNFILQKNNEYYLINSNNEIYKPEEQSLQNLKDLQSSYPISETLFSQILNGSFNILYFSKNPLTQQSILTSDIDIIPNNQLIKMKDFIFTQDFSNIDKITLNQNINLTTNINYINTYFYDDVLLKTENLLKNHCIKINSLSINTQDSLIYNILTSFDNENWLYLNTQNNEWEIQDINNVTNYNTFTEIQNYFNNKEYSDIPLKQLYFQISKPSEIIMNNITIDYETDSQLKILFCDKNGIWKGINPDNDEIININIEDFGDVNKYGITISKFNTLSPQILNEIAVSKIKFQFYMQINNTSDILQLDNLSLQADILGTWKLSSDSDSIYEYVDNKTLRVKIFSDGSYKIRYNFIDINPPEDLLNFNLSIEPYNQSNQIKISWVPPASYDYKNVVIMRKMNEYPNDIYDGQRIYPILPQDSQEIFNPEENVIYDLKSLVNQTTYYYRAFPFDIRYNYNENLNDYNQKNIEYNEN